ncbi:hypothetical protein [Lentibacter sp.]|uniref:hypothetical protein n=1 Tax=Lentibacter sp. TaxID=2024994 RepID=UPI003F6CB004
MFGVVLWSDSQEKKAVIWCEDHGDLAFYGGESSVFDGAMLDAGDLVEFQLKAGSSMRLVQNPALISAEFAPALAQRLKATIVPKAPAPSTAVKSKRAGAQILPFASFCPA